MPLIHRAIKMLADREMTPQLGLLKSTLLQLDSSFSERAYGATSFRDFVEKLAKAGHVALKGADRSFYVELRETGETAATAPGVSAPPPAGKEPTEPRAHREPPGAREGGARGHGRDARHGHPSGGLRSERVEAVAESPIPAPRDTEVALADGVARLGPADGYRIMAQAFSRTGANPRFPMYVRQFKHFMKTFDESFDERRYGFAGLLDALRFGQREGLFRLDRDRQGGVRVHPGAQYLRLTQSPGAAVGGGLATSESPQVGLLPLEVEAAAVEEARPVEDHPPTAPEPPFEVDVTPVAQDAMEASPASSSEGASTGGAESPAEPATTPRGTGRRRTGARTATRVKKTAPPAAGAKKKATRPRAKRSSP
jgi:hypothetical protein